MLSKTQASRHAANQRYTALEGGISAGSNRHGQLDRVTQKIALTISRAGHSRGPPLPRRDQRFDHPPFRVSGRSGIVKGVGYPSPEWLAST
jgi:hypothetical protein